MAQSQIVTLTNPGGVDAGPYNVYAISGTGAATLIGYLVNRSALLIGQLFTNVPDNTVKIRIQSANSLCTNFVDISITLTTSTTTTTTTIAYYSFSLYEGFDCTEACSYKTPITYYSTASTLGNGHVLLNTASTGDPVTDGYYSDGTKCYTVTGGAGLITTTSSCTAPTTTTTTSTTTTTTTIAANAMVLCYDTVEYYAHSCGL